MNIELLTGFHLTSADRKAIKTLQPMLHEGRAAGRIGRTDFQLTLLDDVFCLRKVVRERSSIGADLKPTLHTFTFKIHSNDKIS